MNSRMIFKYRLELVDGPQEVVLPTCAKIVHVATQGQNLEMWADVLTGYGTETRKFEVRGTGHPVSEGAKYIDTVVGHTFAWHVFEVF